MRLMKGKTNMEEELLYLEHPHIDYFLQIIFQPYLFSFLNNFACLFIDVVYIRWEFKWTHLTLN